MSDFYSQPQNLLAVFNSLPGAYLLLSTEFLIEAASDVYLDSTLTRRNDIIGRLISDAFPDNPLTPEAQGVNKVRASLETVLATGKPHEMARQHYDVPDPENPGNFIERHWLPLNSPVIDEQGQVKYIIHSVVNVTEQVQSERLLHQSQAREQAFRVEAERQRLLGQERETFYQIFEQTSAAICIRRGPEYRFEYVNAAYQQFFPERQLLGLPLAEALPETLKDGYVALLDKVYQTGETYFGHEAPLRMEQTGGTFQERYFTFTYQAFREKGQIVGVSTLAYEVTEQVLARQEVEQQQKLLHHLFMEAPAPIGILDGPELVYQLVNPAHEQIFPGRELLGKPILNAFPELADTPIPAILKKVYQTGETFVAQEMPLLLARQAGGPLEEMHWTFTYQARRNLNGEVDGIMVFAHEVTDQVKARRVVEESEHKAKAMAADLAKANEELWVANQETQSSNEELGLANQQLKRINIDLDNFIYTASHDLKTPILNIEGLMGALREELSPESLLSESVQNIMQLILDSVQRFKRTIEHLTEITKLQNENSRDAILINLASLIADVQLDLAPAIQATKAVVEVDVADCPPIHFSIKNMRSIIFNLLSNAIKYYSPERAPLVKIYAQVTDDYQLLVVQDNGLGIPISQQHKLFGLFNRLLTHVEGSGIGLYMVKKIVENAGGKIEVQSKEGEGSTFSIYFKRITNLGYLDLSLDVKNN